MLYSLESWLSPMVGPDLAHALALALLAGGIILASIIANFLAKRYLLVLVSRAVRKSKNRYDDILLEEKIFNRLSHLAPAIVITIVVPLVFHPEEYPILNQHVSRFVVLYLYIVIGLFLSSFFNALGAIYRQFDVSQSRPIKGYLQAAKLFLFLVIATLVVAKIMGESPIGLLSGIGALTAILLLVFKDPILGIVASVQLASNKMVQTGDWISVPNAGADGDVIDVSLTTVKVQNWDKTISYVPIYSLISESFINWRGMSESGGRRIKRSIFLDMNSVRFCDEAMLDKFEKIRLISGYIKERRQELTKHHQEHNLPEDDHINGRRLTNLGTFRRYMSAYLENHPHIHKDMTFLVRYLPCTEKGLPIEMYVFSSDQRWVHYENIQADLTDHFLAILSDFGLRVFQNPSGHDLRGLTQNLTSPEKQIGRD